MERTIALVAGLPNHSRTQETLTNSFIGQLWDSLDHPPLLNMGDEYKWRRPDGSFNVIYSPVLVGETTPWLT
jgi:linoleate 10R-lipoxygenase